MLGWAAFGLGHPYQRAGGRARLRRVHHRRLARRPRLALAVAAARAAGLRARRADRRALGDRDRDRLRRPVLSTSLGGDFATKLIGEQETHGGPYGYYAMLMHLTFWPGSLALLPGIVLGITRRREPAIRYLLLWAATAWLMFEIAPTKLPHYVLPAYPALAALCALWLTDVTASSRVPRIAACVSLALFVIVGIALGGFVAWAPEQYGSGGTIALYLTAAARHRRRARGARAGAQGAEARGRRHGVPERGDSLLRRRIALGPAAGPALAVAASRGCGRASRDARRPARRHGRLRRAQHQLPAGHAHRA